MGKRFTLAALCAAIIQSTQAGVQTLELPPPAQTVQLKAVIEAGTTSHCGMREAPHLIEHLLLSDTRYGETPVDAMLSLRAQGISLSAVTHSDFTEYTLEGPATKAEKMTEAMMVFLSRRSLPKMSFEREKRSILSELRADTGYVSSPSLYERFIAMNADGQRPCAADSTRFMDYDYDGVQAVYEQLYTPATIQLVAQADAEVFDLDAIASTVPRRKAVSAPTSQYGTRETVSTLTVVGNPGQLELIFPIEGRASFPQDGAEALADQIRLEVQSYLRKKYQLYSARTFVDQSLKGGWIRLEVPGMEQRSASEVRDVAEAAINNVDIGQFSADPVWKVRGSIQPSKPIAAPIMTAPPQQRGWLTAVLALFGGWLSSLYA